MPPEMIEQLQKTILSMVSLKLNNLTVLVSKVRGVEILKIGSKRRETKLEKAARLFKEETNAKKTQIFKTKSEN